MAANFPLTVASLSSAAYGVLFVSGIVHRFQRTGSFRALGHSLMQPTVWITLAVALLVCWGLWKRYAWAWWLGLVAAGYQLAMIVLAYVRGGSIGRVPGTWTLISLCLLALVLVMLATRKARTGASR